MLGMSPGTDYQDSSGPGKTIHIHFFKYAFSRGPEVHVQIKLTRVRSKLWIHSDQPSHTSGGEM